ncbi:MULTISPECIES: winged helix-turn-helix domain-containing protein [unclassified Amycolatopsis]|uniref:ArsR/SmtB family transcription factor n=1 Tax=unclassified Amycolatopsis TaxID=2618356 RepID=UPI0028761CF3|nr:MULTISPECIES: winged helix-turn-helix domain-containing protein [unclassified Amycolatopsis]MDS0139415.1 winged helix-turn-helix transcriptional regulator [Amycolatopsis sp. 505]MDS0146994.1 winged helix-turn-helix transcriptional regulator [Amycolatopsis sp. CM201R]
MARLRIHFTDSDIARTRLKLEIDLMWEIVGSVQVLQHADGGLSFDSWRRRVCGGMSRDRDLRAAVSTLVTVAPHAAYFPDFLTPAVDVCDIGESVDAVLSTPAGRLGAEIRRLRPTGSPAARWLGDLGRGKPAALRHLRCAVRLYFEALVEPYLQVIDHGLRTECAGWIQRYLRAGPEGLLGRLGPGANWQRPVLTVDYPVDRDLHLDGRGLLLIPGYFCLYHPVALADPLLRPVLVVPLRTESRLLAGACGGDHVSALLGTTRATILRSVVDGSTTTTLARRIGVTPATVSHHTTVLRDAGLITTDRHENFATHCITPLGLEVLTSARDHGRA